VKFLDEVTIEVRSGRGGNGMVHFHRARHQPRGAPDGGDGGDGGDVVLRADEGCNTLLHLRFNPHHRAEHGVNGGTNNRTGRRGESIFIRVPVGTIVRTEGDAAPVADLTEHGQTFVAASGGRGGRGNAVFKSSTNRTPQNAEEGGPAVELRLDLELRLLADVGLVGLPNAGKSTLVSRISAARPRIADYPFTTLEPSLGMVRHGEFDSFVVADLPGLIEGAHEGHGLGHQFLRHVERTAVLLYVIALEPDAADAPPDQLEVLRHELHAYSEELGSRPTLVGLSKRDLVGDDDEADELVRSIGVATGMQVLAFSSVSGQGIPALVHALAGAVRAARDGREEDA